MHKYFKELDANNNITGICSLTYRKPEQLTEYMKNVFNPIEITEKEYKQIRQIRNNITED